MSELRKTAATLSILALAGLFPVPSLHAQSSGEAPGAADEAAFGAYVVEVSAEDYAFRIPESLPSGWVTLDFENRGEEPHFMLLMRMPEGKTFDDYMIEVANPFTEDFWYPYRDGELTEEEALERLGEVLPEWFWSIEQMGGPGLVTPGERTKVTVKLEPGTYVVECYMKTEDGEFHGMEGMIDPLTVTAEPSADLPPEADLQLRVTNEGIAVTDEIPAGRHTVAVHFVEHGEGFKHNLNVARLDAETEVDQVVHWISFMNLDSLQPPAPAHFLGGVREMAAGNTGYFQVDLAPGRYLWISETTAGLGIHKEFTVR